MSKNGYALEYIKVKTEEICKLAVETHCYALAFVEQFQTEELCIFAVRQDKIVLNNIKDITMKEKIFNLLLKKIDYIYIFFYIIISIKYT